jgi:hypothetical protein
MAQEGLSPMQDKPSGAGNERATTTAEQDDRDQAAVLREVLFIYPATFSLAELIREQTGGSTAFSERDRRVLTEREIALEEAISGEPVASVQIGSFQGRPTMHRADLALEDEDGWIAVEVELTPKSPARLRKIVDAWAGAVRSGQLAAVAYLCEPGQTHRAVERAIASVGAEGQVAVQEVPR